VVRLRQSKLAVKRLQRRKEAMLLSAQDCGAELRQRSSPFAMLSAQSNRSPMCARIFAGVRPQSANPPNPSGAPSMARTARYATIATAWRNNSRFPFMAAILSISCPPGEGYVPSSDYHFAPLRRLTLEVQIDTVPQELNLARVADRLAAHG
jgi:hypothetical protein